MHDATPTYHLLNIYVPSIAGLDSRIWVDSFAPSGKIANIAIRASCDGGSTGAKLILQDDGTSRSATLYSAGKLTLSVTGSNYINLGGPISTNSGTNKWQFFGYTAGAPTVEGYVTVVINGATYRLAAEAI